MKLSVISLLFLIVSCSDKTLEKIKEAKENNFSKLDLKSNNISDLKPLEGLVELETLILPNEKKKDKDKLWKIH